MKQAFINGIILDGTEQMTPIFDHIILVNDNKIEKIVPKAKIEGYKIIDLQGQYILPGLINLHIHLPASGKPKKKPSDPKKLVKLVSKNAFTKKIAVRICQKNAQTQLYSGVTTVRTVGGIMDVDTLIRDKIAAQLIKGPRIIASNMAVSVPEGHMAGSLAYEATSADQASEYVRKIAQDHPDLIKLMITGGVLDAKVKGEPGEMKMDPSLIQAACDTAHALNLKVAAHVESTEGVYQALLHGVDTIEHGAQPTPEILALFKERKAALVTTLSPALPFALFDQQVSHASDVEKYNGKLVFEGIINCAKACMQEGILVGLGTDTGCPYITHYDMWREVYYFHKYCDVSNAFALHTATLVNAKILGIDHLTGSIEAGKYADFIVIRSNPLADLKALRDVEMVVMNGEVLEHPQVKKMANVEQELDKFLS